MNNLSGVKRQSTLTNSELPPLSQAKREIVDRLTRAAKKGIKELNVDQSGDTIVHEAVHLHDYRLFRAIFKNGCAYINTPNHAGDTPLLEAAAAGDYKLVRELFKYGADLSINVPDKEGLTPIHAAVASGNKKLVKFLLLHGAKESVNMASSDELTPLHTALLRRDKKMAALLLRFDAGDSILMKDGSHLTAWQRAIIRGYTTLVQQMLEIKPEVARTLNVPDEYGFTDLERAKTSGPEMRSLLLAHHVEEEIKTHSAEESQTTNDLKRLAEIPIEEFPFPLTIAQNSCNTMIRMKDGKILQLREVSAVDARDLLMQKKHGQDWKRNQGANVLTMYLNPGHGFLRLECSNCDEGKPYNMNRGFSPIRGEKLAYHVPKPSVTKPQRPSGPLTIAANSYRETTIVEDEDSIASVEEANMIFTITPDIETVVLNTSASDKPITMSRNAFDGMVELFLETDVSPSEIAKRTYQTIQRDASDGSTPIPEFKEVERVVQELHTSKKAAEELAEWVQNNIQLEDAERARRILSPQEAQEIAELLLCPPHTSPGPELSSIYNSFVELIREQQGIMLTLKDAVSPQVVVQLLKNPTTEFIQECFKKIGNDGIGLVTLTASEAGRIAKLITSTTIEGGASLASITLDTIKTLPRFTKATIKTAIPYIPYAKEAYEFIGVNKRWLTQVVRENIAMTREQVGNIANEDLSENESDANNSLKIMFYLSDEQAKAALGTIKDVTLSCQENPEKSCRYHLISRNCVDFMQEVFASAGGAGDFVDYFTDEQLEFGHLHTPSRIYEFKAADYGYIRSRGMPHYLRAGMYQKLGNVYNSIASTIGVPEISMKDLPHHFVHIEEIDVSDAPKTFSEVTRDSPAPVAKLPTSSETMTETGPVSTVPYSVSMGDNVGLAFTLAKMSINLFEAIGRIWSYSTDTTASKDQVKNLISQIENIRKALADLDTEEYWINLEHSYLNEDIERLSNEESSSQEELFRLKIKKRQLISLSNQQIDLLFKGMELKKQLKWLAKASSMPGETRVNKLNEEIKEFLSSSATFSIAYRHAFPHRYQFLSED